MFHNMSYANRIAGGPSHAPTGALLVRMVFTAGVGELDGGAVINCPGLGVLEIEMVGASQQKSAPLSVEAFRNWVASRPDEERWELVAGVPMMMAPPTRDHQRIASNLERLLNDAIA